MFEIVIGIILLLFAIGGIWAFVVTRKVKKEGIETEAVVTRVELHEWSEMAGDTYFPDSYTEEYYVTFTNSDGQAVESMLTNEGDNKFKKGDRLKIRYLPDRQDYPVLIEKL